ncbi:hypothetical protein ACFYWX_03235 [Streptomyces sp. NPDC002888]|uniref:hypothetical protein n=1 Tax=Streptomyces sp. NPDC002888 TaxID=3364668 RepID=UPI0036C4DE5F
MGKSASRKDGAEEASFTPQMMREYSAGMAESARIQAQGEAEAMTIRAQGEADARRTRAVADAEVTRVMQEAHGSSPTSSLSVGGRGFRFAFKGTTVTFVAAALLAVGGVVTYQMLTQSNGTPGADRTAGRTGAPTAPTASGTPSPSGVLGAPASGAATADVTGAATGAAAVREERKVVLRSGTNLDVDFTNGQPDISFYLTSNADGYTIAGDQGDLATVNGEPTAESCSAATEFGFTIKAKTIRRGLTSCVLTDENRVAAIRVLGWQKDDEYGLSSVTLDVTTWEKTEEAA